MPFFENNDQAQFEGTLEKNLSEKAMMYVVQWTSRVEKRVELWNMLGNMSEEDHVRSEGPGVKRVGAGCYTYQTGQGGVFIFEADCADKIMEVLLPYGTFIDFTLQPAVTDAELKSVVQKMPFFEKK